MKMVPGSSIVHWSRFVHDQFLPCLVRLTHSKIAKASLEKTIRGKPPLITSYMSGLKATPFWIIKSGPTVSPGSSVVSSSASSVKVAVYA